MNKNTKLRNLALLPGMALLALAIGYSTASYADDHEKSEKADSLYIGDIGDDSVKRFNAKTGQYLGDFVAPGSNGLHGPGGLIFTKGKLYLVNQNNDTAGATRGEVLQYQHNTGKFENVLVSQNDPDAPAGPRSIIRGGGNSVYVAEFNVENGGGAIKQYHAETGKFQGNFDTTGFTPAFFPRGIVRGPDDYIYVSATGDLTQGDGLTGYVLRFNAQDGKFVDVFTSNTAAGCATALHRPEGLVFGPDEKLYITSFRANASDTDKVLVFDSKTGQCVDKIDLAPSVAQSDPSQRAFAQALLFGPDDRLFVPISGNGIHTGEVRSYNVKNKTFNLVVPSNANGGALQAPWYLTFGKTDARTLEYDD